MPNVAEAARELTSKPGQKDMPARHKVALVTGGSSGIGRATADAFVRRGYATVLIDREEESGRRAEAQLRLSGECTFIHCDVTDDAAVLRAVQHAVNVYGGLDVAFHAAGVAVEQGKPTAECSAEYWNKVIATDLTGIFSCMRHEIPQMLKSGGGSIVNCASMAGLVGAPNVPANVAAKHAVVGLTKAAALEYARQNIRVNVVCPGITDTEMLRRAVTPSMIGPLAESLPIGRFGQPAEIAALVLALCDESTGFLTGQAIAIDGGWTAR
jgi:NAD(P)-dependent dehydrogenase (short-subunit alcohol dehydrogenase family)